MYVGLILTSEYSFIATGNFTKLMFKPTKTKQTAPHSLSDFIRIVSVIVKLRARRNSRGGELLVICFSDFSHLLPENRR